jgi:hypothetical protein
MSKEKKTLTHEDDVIEFRPQISRPYTTQYVRIDEILNIPILIKDFVVEKFNDREIMHVLFETVDGKEMATRTSSKVLIKQLKPFEQAFKAGKKLKAKIIRRKRYYTLSPPS